MICEASARERTKFRLTKKESTIPYGYRKWGTHACTSVFPNTGAWEQQERVRRICLISLRFQLFNAFTERKNKVPFSMAIGNWELMHECFPKHSSMGTARMKYDKQTKKVRREDEYGKKQSGHEKKEVQTAYHILIKRQ